MHRLRGAAGAAHTSPDADVLSGSMPDVAIPGDRVTIIQSDECARWIMDTCPHSVLGRVDPIVGFVLAFADDQEATMFRRRWLNG